MALRSLYYLSLPFFIVRILVVLIANRSESCRMRHTWTMRRDHLDKTRTRKSLFFQVSSLLYPSYADVVRAYRIEIVYVLVCRDLQSQLEQILSDNVTRNRQNQLIKITKKYCIRILSYINLYIDNQLNKSIRKGKIYKHYTCIYKRLVYLPLK